MSFFKKMFNKNDDAPRKLSEASELNKGDIIVLTDSFALPENIRNQQFEVTAVNTYEYEHKKQTEWALKGSQAIELFLSLDVDDTTYLKLALKIDDSEVETLFNLDEFSTIFDEPGRAFLERQGEPERLQQIGRAHV